MTDFGKFFDDKFRKKQEEQDAARVEWERKKNEEERTAAALAEPLDRILPPVIEEAKNQLSQKNIDLIYDPSISMDHRGAFKVFKAYRFERKRPDRGRDMSGVFGFRIYNSGSIEGFIEELSPQSRFALRRVFLKKPDELVREDIESVIETAIESLVANSRR